MGSVDGFVCLHMCWPQGNQREVDRFMPGWTWKVKEGQRACPPPLQTHSVNRNALSNYVAVFKCTWTKWHSLHHPAFTKPKDTEESSWLVKQRAVFWLSLKGKNYLSKIHVAKYNKWNWLLTKSKWWEIPVECFRGDTNATPVNPWWTCICSHWSLEY